MSMKRKEEKHDEIKSKSESRTRLPWELIEPLLPEPKRRKDKRGRPWASNRACLEGILWVLQTGARGGFCPTSILRLRPVGGG